MFQCLRSLKTHRLGLSEKASWLLFGLIEYADATPEVRAVYDDIMATRKTDWVNNFWKAIAHDPVMLRRTWEDIKQIMAPGALDPLTKEMIYVAVSVSNQCDYCIASHTGHFCNCLSRRFPKLTIPRFKSSRFIPERVRMWLRRR